MLLLRPAAVATSSLSNHRARDDAVTNNCAFTSSGQRCRPESAYTSTCRAGVRLRSSEWSSIASTVASKELVYRTAIVLPAHIRRVVGHRLPTMTAARESEATSGPRALATYARVNLGRRASVARGNDVGTSYGYDAVSRVT